MPLVPQLLQQGLGAVVGLLLGRAAVGQAQPGPGQLDRVVEDEEVVDRGCRPGRPCCLADPAPNAWAVVTRLENWTSFLGPIETLSSSDVAKETSRPLSSIDSVVAGRGTTRCSRSRRALRPTRRRADRVDELVAAVPAAVGDGVDVARELPVLARRSRRPISGGRASGPAWSPGPGGERVLALASSKPTYR